MNVGILSGRVIGLDGNAVAGASVSVAGSDSSQPVSDIAALTQADGAFRFGNLAPGPYTLFVHCTGYAPANANVVVAANERVETTIRIVNRPIRQSFLEVTLVTDRIDWDQVRLVRASLAYEDPEHGLAWSKDFLFSRSNRAAIVWKVPVKDENRDRYTANIVYFMKSGAQKKVGPKIGNNRTLMLGHE